MDYLAERFFQFLGNAVGQFSRREKLLLLIGTALSFAGFWYAGKLFRIPVYPHFSASLLQQPSRVIALLVVALVFFVSVVLALLVAGRVGPDSGLICASLGLTALSIRGGAMRFTLQAAANDRVWVMLLLELAILAVLVAATCIIEKLLKNTSLVRDQPLPQMPAPINDVGRKILALLTTTILMALLMCIFTASDRKAQCIIAVAISSFFATLLAYSMLPVHPGYWYWPATFMAGAIGYGLAASGKVVGWQIGEVTGGWTAALARPLPLDYASVGVAASLFAYWAGRRWESHLELDTVPEPAT